MNFFNNFTCIDDIANKFRDDKLGYDDIDPTIINELKDADILFASYGGAMYEGSALVVYSKNGMLYEVHGSHCSCNGLEGQWKAEETSYEAINMRFNDEYSIKHFKEEHGEEATVRLLKILLLYEVEKNLLT